MIWVFLGAMVVFTIWAAIASGKSKESGTKYRSSYMTQAERNFAQNASKATIRGLDATRSSTVDIILSDYESNYVYAKSTTSLRDTHIYEDDLRELREHRDDLRREEWYEKADKILEKFYDLYSIITDPDFRDVEQAYKSKARCIKYWQEYFYSMPDDNETRYNPKEHLREMIWYEPCMDSHVALEKKLSACIEEMRPEYKRKIALKKRMVDIVAEHGTILRADLMKKLRDGYTDLELKYCYKELIEKYVLSEVKYSNRYITSLSEKEKLKRQKKDETQKESPSLGEGQGFSPCDS